MILKLDMSSILKFCDKCNSLLNFVSNESSLTTKCSVCGNEPDYGEKHIKLKISTLVKKKILEYGHLKYDRTFQKTRSFKCQKKECNELSPEFLMVSSKNLDGRMRVICTNCGDQFTLNSKLKVKVKAKILSNE